MELGYIRMSLYRTFVLYDFFVVNTGINVYTCGLQVFCIFLPAMLKSSVISLLTNKDTQRYKIIS